MQNMRNMKNLDKKRNLRVPPCIGVRLIVPVNLHIRFHETMENVESTRASPDHSTVSM